MSAADVCRRLIAAVDDRDWATAAEILDARTVVSDHREMPYEGDGAQMLALWRTTFDARPHGRADLEVLDAREDAALVRIRFGEPGQELVVHVVAAVEDGRITRFDAYERAATGERSARAHFARGS